MIKLDGDGQFYKFENKEWVTLDSSEVYSDGFLTELNSGVSKLNVISDYANELFLYFYLKQQESKQLLSKNTYTRVNLNTSSYFWFLIIAVANKGSISLFNKIKYYFLSVLFVVNFSFYSIASLIVLPSYLTFLFFRSHKRKCTGSICIVRSNATHEKIKKFVDLKRINLFSDATTYKSSVLFSVVSLLSLKRVLLSYIYIPWLVLRDTYYLFRDSMVLLKPMDVGFVLNYYRKRLPHKVLFEYILDSVLTTNYIQSFYTGNKEDRYAILETKICRKHGVPIYCIPHGLEYSFKFPLGLAGDIFYTTTSAAKIYLSRLYGDSSKFVYDYFVADLMFNKSEFVSSKSRELIVFFTEPRDVFVNLKIINILIKSGVEFFVKLHPNESKDDYKVFPVEINFIEDFNDSITSNICISRKSTILIEALYNGSKSVSILIDPKDESYSRLIFPSLSDESIVKYFDEDSFLGFLSNIKDNVIPPLK